MKLYLAGEHDVKNGRARYNGGGWHDLCVLESFFYARNNKYFEMLYSKGVDLLLDSGEYTFMANTPPHSSPPSYFGNSLRKAESRK